MTAVQTFLRLSDFRSAFRENSLGFYLITWGFVFPSKLVSKQRSVCLIFRQRNEGLALCRVKAVNSGASHATVPPRGDVLLMSTLRVSMLNLHCKSNAEVQHTLQDDWDRSLMSCTLHNVLWARLIGITHWYTHSFAGLRDDSAVNHTLHRRPLTTERHSAVY